MHRWPGRVSKRDGAATDGADLVPVPDKANGHLSSAFNALCPVMTGDKLQSDTSVGFVPVHAKVHNV